MTIPSHVFRSYDIRGIADQDLSDDFARALARAFVRWLTDHGALIGDRTLVVGRDMRQSSGRLSDALIAGLIESGITVKDVGLVASEQFYYACAVAETPGLMVTASHNPAEYGGFKMVKKIPAFVGGDDLQAIRAMMETETFAPALPGGTHASWDIHPGFVEKMRSFITPSAWTRSLSIVVDAGNGMGGPMAEETLAGLPLSVRCLFCDPDGRFPNRSPNPLLPENRRFVEAAVRSQPTDVGILFDGDADRVFLVDETGVTLPGDFLTALLGKYFCQRDPGASVLFDVRSSWAVRDLVAAAGGKPIVSRVGHTHIKQKIQETGTVFGGEVSGHFYYRDFFGVDSGMLTALLVIDLLATRGGTLSALAAPLFAKYFLSGELNFTVADAPAVLAKIRQHFRGATTVYELDGFSVEEADWHCNVRSSNTEPLLRLNVEALSMRLLEEKLALLTSIIQANSH